MTVYLRLNGLSVHVRQSAMGSKAVQPLGRHLTFHAIRRSQRRFLGLFKSLFPKKMAKVSVEARSLVTNGEYGQSSTKRRWPSGIA